jgi:hypothetical protein
MPMVRVVQTLMEIALEEMAALVEMLRIIG